jgi:hypothetical protein
MFDATVGASCEQVTRRARIVAVVLQRIANGFGHDRMRGEMHDRIDRVLAQNVGDQRSIRDIADHELRATNGLPKACREIIEYDDGLAALGELHDGVAADVAGAARDEDRFASHDC